METFLNIALPVALAAVLIVLILGIITLMRGGATAKSHSNRLMRLRVLFQFIAVILLAVGFYWHSRGGG